ncbi:MAG: glycosyltransferase family 2 protein [Limisphaerales bacterium]
MKISFCLITLNEEENLGRCLRSCTGLADEIVIVDSGSNDGTERIAKEFGARFVHQDWLGYRDQKNKALELAGNDWIFSLDADEELSEQLRREVAQLKREPPDGNVAGFSMPRCVHYEGRWIRHGDWYPDRLVRLFRKSKSRFTGGKVHERLEVNGTVRPLKGDLHHYSFRDAEDHWNRCQKYARLWAEMQNDSGKKVGPLAPVSRGAFKWIRNYLLRAGFLDGAQGWKIAAICAREVHYKYSLLRELQQK